MPKTVFKIKVSDILVGRDTVRVGAFVAPSEDHTFQRCGELTLTVEEANRLKELVEAPYEYAIQVQNPVTAKWALWDGEYLGPRFGVHWGTLEERTTFRGELTTDYPERSFRLVKRLKAGKIEVV